MWSIISPLGTPLAISLILSIVITLIQVIVSVLAAYGLVRYRNKVSTIVFAGYVLLALLPVQVTIVPNYLITGWLGIRGGYWSVILPAAFATFGTFLLYQFIAAIPSQVLEAAETDGAGPMGVLRHIVFPLIRNGIALTAFMCFVDNWNAVELPQVLLDQPGMMPLAVVLGSGESDHVIVDLVVFAVPPLALFLAGHRLIEQGLAEVSIQ